MGAGDDKGKTNLSVTLSLAALASVEDIHAPLPIRKSP